MAHYRFNKLTLISIGEIFRIFFSYFVSVVSSQLCWLFAFVYFRYSCDLTISPIYPQKESYGRLFICEMSARASAHQKEAIEMVHRYAAYCGWVYHLYYFPKYIFETRKINVYCFGKTVQLLNLNFLLRQQLNRL